MQYLVKEVDSGRDLMMLRVGPAMKNASHHLALPLRTEDAFVALKPKWFRQ